MLNGCCDCVRGSQNTPVEELEFILEASESVGLICEDADTLRSLVPKIRELNEHQPTVRFAVSFPTSQA